MKKYLFILFILHSIFSVSQNIEISDELNPLDICEIIRIEPSFVTVNTVHSDKHATKEFVRLGAQVIVGNRFDKAEITAMIRIRPGRVTANIAGFDMDDTEEFVRFKCQNLIIPDDIIDIHTMEHMIRKL